MPQLCTSLGTSLYKRKYVQTGVPKRALPHCSAAVEKEAAFSLFYGCSATGWIDSGDEKGFVMAAAMLGIKEVKKEACIRLVPVEKGVQNAVFMGLERKRRS